MNGRNKPSIFTSKDPQPPPAAFPLQSRLAASRAPSSSSPFLRRRSDPITTLNPATPLANSAAVHRNTSSVQPPREPLPTTSTWRSYTDSRAIRTDSGASSKGRSTSVASIITTPPAEYPPYSSNSLPSKRRFAPDNPESFQTPTSEPPSKRARLRPKPKHTLDSFSFGSPSFTAAALQPPSPLFFSNSPKPRPALPPRFSSGEAAATMLSKARAEDSHISRVSLPYGTISTPGPPTSAPQLGRRSLERSVTGRSNSPDGGNAGREGTSAMLNSIGIVELLEQDDRPTFVVDLGDNTNYGPGPLNPVFANSALRSCEELQPLVYGSGSEEDFSRAKAFLQFKSWLLSSAIQGESLNVCLPPLNHAGMTWSCSTLRKRLRVVAGTLSSPFSSSTTARRVSAPPSEALSASLPLETIHEPTDYFGEATNDEQEIAPDSSAVPTIEPSSAGKSDSDLQALYAESQDDLSGALDLLPSQYTYVQAPFTSEEYVSPSGSMLEVLESSHMQYELANHTLRGSQIATVASDSPSFDWTRLPLTENMPPHIKFARSIDWASTSLGPIETWSNDLRQMCNLIMASPHPAAMYWGDDLIAIYNEAYILLAGQKHPSLMGMSYRDAWREIWHEVEGVFKSARETGQATMKEDDPLFIRRTNFLEETYFSWSIIPMVGSEGKVSGLYNPAFEKTRRKIAERRMLTLREIGERTASARDVKGFWTAVLGSFDFNEFDSPFLILYSVSDESDSDSSSVYSSSVTSAARQCALEGSLGIPDGHPAAPAQIDFRTGMEGFGPVFREVVKADKPLLLEVGTSDLPSRLVDGLLQSRGFGDAVRSVVICAIHPTTATGDSVLGFLVLGINPRRPYDDDYALFVQLLSRQLATSLASVVLFEEEIKRGQKAAQLAALDRIELSEQLAIRTQEAIDSETRFSRMAEFAPVGMFIADSQGAITFANDTWYDISQVPKNSADTWMDAINPEDANLVRSLWRDLVVERKLVSRSEFRFKETWVLFSAYPEKLEDGGLKCIFGSITDISQQKWAEGIQTRKMEEAVEMKRQQENFIDITSHEMRNPLSAILQCADEIATSLTKHRREGGKALPDDLIMNCLDAAQTISLCSQHQKRIVDDILTLSKLDSQLLLVTPVDAQPLTVVQRALKMHSGELQQADISMRFVVDRSWRDMNMDWVRCDPSRVLQVLINLTTNAIKFTGTESRRTITVTIAASKDKPSERPNEQPVKYFPTRSKNRDKLDEKDWGDGERVYIHFAVKDTGRGLSPEEKKLLFIRFSQASPRTHVQYGGSGLGLFISRELTELQGGEIGVESEAGKGSTFAFFIAGRRSSPPQDFADVAMGSQRPAPDLQRRKSIPTAPIKPLAAHVGRKITSTAQSIDPRKHVLIVEDNLVNQKVLQKQLNNLGIETHVANHGEEAIEKVKQSTYWKQNSTNGTLTGIEIGVVLMDQEMPLMDGLTCTREIREYEAQDLLVGRIPIIMVSANARPEQLQTAVDAGMDAVVSKPFRILPDLIPKIDELLQRYPMPRAGAQTSPS